MKLLLNHPNHLEDIDKGVFLRIKMGKQFNLAWQQWWHFKRKQFENQKIQDLRKGVKGPEIFFQITISWTCFRTEDEARDVSQHYTILSETKFNHQLYSLLFMNE